MHLFFKIWQMINVTFYCASFLVQSQKINQQCIFVPEHLFYCAVKLR